MPETEGKQPEVPLLQLRGVKKHFGAVQALYGVDFDVPAGQVTALLGDNGAGKSVLIKTIAGIHEADDGEILWEGKPVRIRRPSDASALGIEVVYQDLALCDNLDVVENMFLGRERLSGGLLDEDAMEEAARATLAELNVRTVRSVRMAVESLSGGQRQSVAVAKAVMWNSKLVILDEPTAALGVAQTRQVLALVRRLAEAGLAVMLVSHNMHDVFAVADRMVILRLGRVVGAGPAEAFDPRMAVELMTLGHTTRTPDPASRGGIDAQRRAAAEKAEDENNDAAPAAEAEPAAIAVPATGPVAVAAVGPSDSQSYFAALRSRILAGQSGVLPVILGAVLIAALFQSQNREFLSAGNLVNLLVQASVFMLVGMGEVFVLLLGEVDLSVGFVAGISGVVVTELVSPAFNWPWWGAMLVALLSTAALGFLQGSLVTRLRLPSFVVTLAGLLGFEGLMIALLGTGGTLPVANAVINDLANGTFSPAVSWIVTGAIVVVFAVLTLTSDRKRRRAGLATPPFAVVLLKIAAAVVAAIVLVLICNVNRGLPAFPFSGMPWVVPIVFAVLVGWSFLLGRTRLGRYIYAIGGNAEAARRAGISLVWIRTTAFLLASATAGLGGIIYASRLRSISTSLDGGTIALYAVASAVIGGTSLFGGRGHPLHAVLGGLIIAGVVNGMALLGLSAAVQLVATAIVLLASVTVDVVVRRRGATTR